MITELLSKIKHMFSQADLDRDLYDLQANTEFVLSLAKLLDDFAITDEIIASLELKTILIDEQNGCKAIQFDFTTLELLVRKLTSACGKYFHDEQNKLLQHYFVRALVQTSRFKDYLAEVRVKYPQQVVAMFSAAAYKLYDDNYFPNKNAFNAKLIAAVKVEDVRFWPSDVVANECACDFIQELHAKAIRMALKPVAFFQYISRFPPGVQEAIYQHFVTLYSDQENLNALMDAYQLNNFEKNVVVNFFVGTTPEDTQAGKQSITENEALKLCYRALSHNFMVVYTNEQGRWRADGSVLERDEALTDLISYYPPSMFVELATDTKILSNDEAISSPVEQIRLYHTTKTQTDDLHRRWQALDATVREQQLTLDTQFSKVQQQMRGLLIEREHSDAIQQQKLRLTDNYHQDMQTRQDLVRKDFVEQAVQQRYPQQVANDESDPAQRAGAIEEQQVKLEGSGQVLADGMLVQIASASHGRLNLLDDYNQVLVACSKVLDIADHMAFLNADLSSAINLCEEDSLPKLHLPKPNNERSSAEAIESEGQQRAHAEKYRVAVLMQLTAEQLQQVLGNEGELQSTYMTLEQGAPRYHDSLHTTFFKARYPSATFTALEKLQCELLVVSLELEKQLKAFCSSNDLLFKDYDSAKQAVIQARCQLELQAANAILMASDNHEEVAMDVPAGIASEVWFAVEPSHRQAYLRVIEQQCEAIEKGEQLQNLKRHYLQVLELIATDLNSMDAMLWNLRQCCETYQSYLATVKSFETHKASLEGNDKRVDLLDESQGGRTRTSSPSEPSSPIGSGTPSPTGRSRSSSEDMRRRLSGGFTSGGTRQRPDEPLPEIMFKAFEQLLDVKHYRGKSEQDMAIIAEKNVRQCFAFVRGMDGPEKDLLFFVTQRVEALVDILEDKKQKNEFGETMFSNRRSSPPEFTALAEAIKHVTIQLILPYEERMIAAHGANSEIMLAFYTRLKSLNVMRLRTTYNFFGTSKVIEGLTERINEITKIVPAARLSASPDSFSPNRPPEARPKSWRGRYNQKLVDRAFSQQPGGDSEEYRRVPS